MRRASRNWGLAWVALTIAFALHVWDEAANDFLSIYNPTVEAIRDRWSFVPLPTFTFGVWLTGLVIAVAVLALLAPAAFRGREWLRFLAYPYALVMFFNGVQHIATSIYFGKVMPGVVSSPLLLIASVALLIATKRAVQASGSAASVTNGAASSR